MDKNIDKEYLLNRYKHFGIDKLPQEVLDDYFSRMKVVKKKRHDLLLKEGEVCTNFAIMRTGLMRIFHYKKGKDISDVFLGDGSFCVSIESFFNEKPSDRLIEILEPAEIYLLPRKDLIELCDKYLEFDLFAQSMIAFVVGVLQRKVELLQFATAEERLEMILQDVPDLMQRVSSVQVASYLGVTPETLSRVRGRMARRNE